MTERRIRAGWVWVAVALLAVLVPVPLVDGATSGSPNPLCTTEPCAPVITGWLHTEPGSTSVYDSNGDVVPLLGINVDGLDFGTGNPATSPDPCGKGWSIPPTSYDDVAPWGFNFIRVPITWENLEPTAPTLAPNGTWVHHWNSAFLEELDAVASGFGKDHVAVMWDFAQVDVSGAFQQAPEKVQGGECEGWGNPTWLYPSITSPTTSEELATAMCNFFNDRSVVGTSAPTPIEGMEAAETMLAARYADDPTVMGIDMFNEPWFGSSCGSVSSEGGLLTSFYTKMGQAIEAVNPHLLVAFEEPPPGLMSQTPIMTSPPSVPNAMYSFHIYTGNWDAAQPYVKAYLGNANSWGVPSWMGEFDAFEAGCTGPNCESILDPDWQADTQSLLSFCNTNSINWSFFSYYSLGTDVATPVPKADILAVLRTELPTLAAGATTTTASTSASSTSTSATATASTSTGTASTPVTVGQTTTSSTASAITTSSGTTTATSATSSTPTITATSQVPEFGGGALLVALLGSMVAVVLLVGRRGRPGPSPARP